VSGGVVALATNAGTLSAVNDHNNGTYTATLTSATTVGEATISGTLDTHALTQHATVQFTVGAVSLAQSTITATPTSITANGVTTSAITVQLKDAHNNNLPVSGGTIALATTAGTLGTVNDNNNGTYSATLTSATTVGTATITGSIGGQALTQHTTVEFTVGAVSLAQSTITAAPASITADGAATSTITVQLKDAHDNNLQTSGGVVALATTSGTLSGVTDNGTGTYTATLTSPTTVGAASITGTLGGQALAHNANVSFTVGVVSLAQSTITASPTSITADGFTTSTITVQLKDANNNNLPVSGGTIALVTSLGTLGTVNDHNNGTYTATLTSATTAGTATITGTLDGQALTQHATVGFTVGAVSLAQTLMTASPTSITADGITISTITVQLKDAHNNNIPVSGGAVVLAATVGSLGTVTDHSNGTYTAILTSSTTVGTATITGTLGGQPIAQHATVDFTVGVVSLAQSLITASPASITANGSSASTITVQLKDANNNNLGTSGGTVALATTAGTLGTVVNNNNGTYTATLTSSTTVGTATITGTLDAQALTHNATVQFTVGAVSLAQSTITASPTSITADGSTTSIITVQLKDANGNNLAASVGLINLATTAGSVGTVTDHTDGTYTATLTSATTVATATITGTLNGQPLTHNATVQFTVGALSLATSLITASPTSITADGSTTSIITVQLKDAHDNNLLASGGVIALTSTSGSLSAVTDNGTGTYTATLISSTTAGTATITGTLGGQALTHNAAVVFTVGAASLAQSTITASAVSIVADGATTSIITVQLKDANNNNLAASSGVIVLSTTTGTLTAVTDHTNGTYTATLTSATTVGTATITGTRNGQALTHNATVAFTVGPVSVLRTTISAGLPSIPANGTSTSLITVQLKDAHDNNLAVGAGTVALTTTAGSIGGVTDQGDGTYTALLQSGTTGASAIVSGTLNGTAITDTARVAMIQIMQSITGNAGVAGVTLTWMDGTTQKTATSDAQGLYIVSVPYLWSGTVTPSLTGYTFVPINRTYTTISSDQTDHHYAATAFVTVNIKAFLGGAYSGTTMRTSLNTSGLIPLSSEAAYTAAGYGVVSKTVSAIPNVTIVDWVLVELRSATDGGSKAAIQPAFIKNDGTVVDVDGTSVLTFSGVHANPYYIIVRHRNHLPIMSANPVVLNAVSAAYDFTTDQTKAYGTLAMAELATGVFGMYPGDIDRDGSVFFTGLGSDRAGLLDVVGITNPTLIIHDVYSNADVNMDGKVQFTGIGSDRSVILSTVGIANPTLRMRSQVPN
jgi:adhesin/invasin